MRVRTVPVLLGVMAAAAPAVLGDATVTAARAILEVGHEAPGFTLPGSDGKTYSLKDYRGQKAVVIAWFPKAFTGG